MLDFSEPVKASEKVIKAAVDAFGTVDILGKMTRLYTVLRYF
jgi:hypothetical protein